MGRVWNPFHVEAGKEGLNLGVPSKETKRDGLQGSFPHSLLSTSKNQMQSIFRVFQPYYLKMDPRKTMRTHFGFREDFGRSLGKNGPGPSNYPEHRDAANLWDCPFLAGLKLGLPRPKKKHHKHKTQKEGVFPLASLWFFSSSRPQKGFQLNKAARPSAVVESP